MTNYTKTTDFAAKDSLPSGDSGKIIRGTEFETEFDNIATAVNSKSDANNPTFTGTVTIDGLTVNGNTVLGNAATDTVTVTADIASNLLPSADDTYNLGAVGAEWNDLFIDGVANIDSLVANTADINGGTVDGVTIGGSSAGAITGTTITGTGFVTSGNMSFGDGDRAVFGAGSDLQVFHDGSNSYIADNGTGDLFISGAANITFRKAGTSEVMAQFSQDGAASLYYDNAQKLATTSTGIDVTGVITTDGMTTSADINFGDNDKAIFGAGSDLQIYHDGSNSVIHDFGTGNLNIIANAFALYEGNGTDLMIGATPNGAVTLSHNAQTKLATTSTGIDVTGTATTDGLTVQTSQGNISIPTSTSSLNFDRAGSNYIRATDAAGSFTFITGANDFATQRMKLVSNGDVSFFEDTGTTAKFQWSASDESLSLIKTASGVTKALKLYNNTAGANNRVGIDFHTASTLYGTIEAGYGATSPEMNFKVGGGTPSQILKLNSTGIDVTGTVVSDGLSVTTGNDATAVFNRTATGGSSVGSVVEFERAGALAGHVGSQSNGYFYIGQSDCNLAFSASNNIMFPRGTDGASRDGALGLGNSSNRFKDGHFSGNINANTFTAINGVYIGGTGFANKLDDYEEGTFTPSFSGGDYTFTYNKQKGSYTKIGNRVFVDMLLYIDSSTAPSGTTDGDLSVTGLPFTFNAQNTVDVLAVSIGFKQQIANAEDSLSVRFQSGNTEFKIHKDLATGFPDTTLLQASDLAANSRLRIQFSYPTNS